MATKTAKTKKTVIKPMKKVGKVGVIVKKERKTKVLAEEEHIVQELVEVKTEIKQEAKPKIKTEAETKTEKPVAKPKPGIERYYEAVGRRKEATARVRLYTKKSTDVMPSEDKAIMTVNDKQYFEYFKAPELYMTADAPLRKLKSINRFKATALVKGGGAHGQADAVRHGLARALVIFDQNFSKKLRKAGYLTRDARVKERRKYGLKKARKSPQWAKR